MKCRETTERLDAWLDGELTEAEAAGIGRHVAECAACGEVAAGRRALGGLLRDGLTYPAEAAAAAGRFDDLWERIAAETTALQPQPSPAPSLWQRLAAWWTGRVENRQLWVPAFAAAAALVVMVGLITLRLTGGGEGPRVTDAPTAELPPFAEPRVAELSAPAREPQRQLAEGTAAPRRRGSEEMVARAGGNEAFVVSYEVDRGIVLIEQPDEAEGPMIVWHLLPEDVEGDEDSI
jgi:negative regulator of sigma E activity